MIRVGVDSVLCIACGLCHERAPDNLEVPPGEFTAVVVKQPEGESEIDACTEAAEYCPTGGIMTSQSADSGEGEAA